LKLLTKGVDYMKMPPREKIHEALTAIIDERINPDEENNKAEVFSSDQSKKYLVEWHYNENSSMIMHLLASTLDIQSKLFNFTRQAM
jgi:hypothetical protein